MIKLAYVTTTFPTLAWFIENEVHRLRERGFDIRVWTLRAVSNQFQPEHRTLLEITSAIGSPFSAASWAALAGWLVRKPHVLIPETSKILWASRRSLYALAGHLAYLPAAARVARLVETEQIDHLHGAWAHFPGTVAYLASRLTGCGFSLAGHAGGDLYRTQAFLAEKVRAASFIMTCVRGNGAMLETLAGPRARVLTIYHGVDLGRFDGHGRERSPEPLLVSVGRLATAKGFDVAIRALGVLKGRGLRPKLVVIGEGPERPALEARVRELGLADQVELPGAKTHDELLPYYRRAWALLAPSMVLANNRQDGIPNVVVEAMAMGVPVIGTDAGGIAEIVVPGETGALCRQGDPESMADQLEPLLRDPAPLDAMGSRARGRVLRDFDARRNVEQVLTLFMEREGSAGGSDERIAGEAGGAL